jgi:hypothetical protein
MTTLKDRADALCAALGEQHKWQCDFGLPSYRGCEMSEKTRAAIAAYKAATVVDVGLLTEPTMREQFENAVKQLHSDYGFSRDSQDPDSYYEAETASLWCIWQAAMKVRPRGSQEQVPYIIKLRSERDALSIMLKKATENHHMIWREAALHLLELLELNIGESDGSEDYEVMI